METGKRHVRYILLFALIIMAGTVLAFLLGKITKERHIRQTFGPCEWEISDSRLTLRPADGVEEGHAHLTLIDRSDMSWKKHADMIHSVYVEPGVDVDECSGMFADLPNCTEMDLENLDVSRCYEMDYMFSGCVSLKTVKAKTWDTGNVRTMRGMFENCRNLTEIEMDGWDVGNVTDFGNMFLNCEKFGKYGKPDISGWDVSSAEDMRGMFANCAELSESTLDAESWNLEAVPYRDGMLLNCDRLKPEKN